MQNNDIILEKYEHLGFIYECLLSEAVTEAEVLTSLEHLVAACDDINLLEIYANLLGHHDSDTELIQSFDDMDDLDWMSPLTDSQDEALTGIAYQRGTIPYEHTPALEANAKHALKKHPEVTRLFRKFFPFIDF